MKLISRLLFVSLLLVVISSCKKDENQVFLEEATPPALTATRTGTIPLSFATANNEAIALTWTNPDYQFTTGTSSQDVRYTLEIDTTGANFTNPKRQTITISNDMSRAFTVAEFNNFLLNQLQLDSLSNHNIEIRVTASIGGAAAIASNVLKFTGVRPYAIPPVVTPPASNTLFITGSATPGNWMGGGDPELPAQKFTRINKTLYVLNSIQLIGGQSYLLVPRYGNWTPVPPDPEKYGFIGAGNQNNVDGDDFKALGGDIKSPAATGLYKIEVDFQRGKFTVTKL